MCIHVVVCSGVHVCRGAHVCARMGRPEDNFGCHSLSESLTRWEFADKLDWLARNLRYPLSPLPQCWDYERIAPHQLSHRRLKAWTRVLVFSRHSFYWLDYLPIPGMKQLLVIAKEIKVVALVVGKKRGEQGTNTTLSTLTTAEELSREELKYPANDTQHFRRKRAVWWPSLL